MKGTIMTDQVETVTTEDITPTRFTRFKNSLTKINATYVVIGAAAAVATAVTIIGIAGAKNLESNVNSGYREEPANEPTPEVVETTQE
jgi:hypothetical protein